MMQPMGEATPLLKRQRHRPSTEGHYQQQYAAGGASYDDDDTITYGSDKERRGIVGVIAAMVTRRLPRSFFRKNTPIPNDSDSATHYYDTHNDASWKCMAGTGEDSGIWMNHADRVGTIMAGSVWLLFGYSALTILLLATDRHCPSFIAALYLTLAALALASHAKTSLTDPGSVPCSATPIDAVGQKYYTMCSICQTFKPESAHHCRICRRCISRMDHHCPWMNNCIGADNMKHFILFLIYTWTSSALALLLFGTNYFFCNGPQCEFTSLEIQLVRAMAWLATGALMFTTSMLVSVTFGIMTGVGTIDRLKRKASDTWESADDKPLPLADIFGMGQWWTWCLPMDPVFDDFDRVHGYAEVQRLLRDKEEQCYAVESFDLKLGEENA